MFSQNIPLTVFLCLLAQAQKRPPPDQLAQPGQRAPPATAAPVRTRRAHQAPA